MREGYIDPTQWANWVEEHGEDYVTGKIEYGPNQVSMGFLWPDGSFVGQSGFIWQTAKYLGPRAPYFQAKMQIQYWALRQAAAERVFNDFKDSIHSKDQIPQLESLKETVMAFREEVRGCKEVIDSDPEVILAKQREANLQASVNEQRRARQEAKSLANQIEI